MSGTRRLIACRQRPAADGVNTFVPETGFNTANARIACQAPAGSAISDIVLGFPQFFLGYPEADLPLPETVSAALEYPEGRFHRVRFLGAERVTVLPGRGVVQGDPLDLTIPAGAAFWIRLHRRWRGGLVRIPAQCYGVNIVPGEWCEVGAKLPDATMSGEARHNSYAYPHTASVGLGCQVLARHAAPGRTLAIVGDSLSHGAVDLADPLTGGAGIERGLRGVLGVSNLSRQQESLATFLQRHDGRMRLLAEGCTDVLLELGRNDLTDGATEVQVRERLRRAVAVLATCGARLHATTVTPRSHSSDGFITTENQWVAHPEEEVYRRGYNDWLRAAWAGIGFAGLFDYAAAIDPEESGLWPGDGNAGYGSAGVPERAGGRVISVGLGAFAGGIAGGQDFPASAEAHPCRVLRHPDDLAGGPVASASCATDAQGRVTGYTVRDGGQHDLPPLIAPLGQWTFDGLHPTRRGNDELISRLGFGASRFA